MKNYTKKQSENLANKVQPQLDREYIITDFCFWAENAPEDYNIFDKDRKPHAVSLVDKETGTMVMLQSGSVIKIVSAKK